VGILVKFRVKKIVFDNAESYLINLQDSTMTYRLKIKQEKEKMARNTQATVNHEMRTPINTTIVLSKMMLLKEKDPSKRKQLKTMLHANKILLCNVNNNLDNAQIHSASFKPKIKSFNPKKTLQKLLDMLEGQA